MFFSEARHLPPVRGWTHVIVIALCGLVGSADAGPRGPADDSLYMNLCGPCHGASGDGLGPASPWLWPKPRDFTTGEYKWRSTSSGLPPTAADLAAAIRYGVPSTSMHAFGDVLTNQQVTALIEILKTFAPKKFRRSATPIAMPTAPEKGALVARGHAAYLRLGCTRCHGTSGGGDGPSAKSLRDGHGRLAPPYDFRSMPLKRPAALDADPVLGIYKSIVTGLSGTAMPSYEGSAPAEELLAVAAYIDSIRYKGSDPRTWRERVTVHPSAAAEDRKKKLTRAGYWPSLDGVKESGDAVVWGDALTLNGKAPESLAPAQASLSAKQCARCHAPQYRQWTGSLHAKAGSPGLIAQLIPMAAHEKGASLESCQRCHAPLAEQLPLLRKEHWGKTGGSKTYQRNPFYDSALREEGINCASCHVRKWSKHGPGQPEGSKLLAVPGYTSKTLPIYERSDFCLGCHQLQPRLAIGGRPLLNTYREWLEGPYMRRGIQCQSCHMPTREHEWKGVHDPDTFRQGITVAAIAERTDGVVSARARVKNSGAGHFLPTTPTPAAYLRVELVDARGRTVEGSRRSKRIGRHIVFRGGRFRDIEDTRIPPGESIELSAGWKGGDATNAAAVKISVRVAPDDYYEGMYEGRLRSKALGAKERVLFEEALRRGRASHYTAYERTISLR